MKQLFLFMILVCTWLCGIAADPMATDFTYDQCCGSLIPYPTDIKHVAYPDTLKPVFINHVGRHGARYPASDSSCKELKEALDRAREQGTITKLGIQLAEITDMIIDSSTNRWGALDSLGEYEQRMIAARMYESYKPVFDNARINAISSYSPRCMMSMFCFLHQLDRMDNKNEFISSTGRVNSPLLRPFDTDPDYKEYAKSRDVVNVYNNYFDNNCPTTAIERVLGKDFAYQDERQKQNLAITEYYVLSSLPAMAIDCDVSRFFTKDEINTLWSCFNLRQYLKYSANTISMLPADIASDLLLDLINTTDDFIDGKSKTSVRLRFGHAETLMPLLSLMRIKGCYYMTNYYDTVAKNWQDFNIVPMAANLQMVLFRHTVNDRYYLRVDLNESPVKLIPNSAAIYIPWDQARAYLMHCVPSYNINK